MRNSQRFPKEVKKGRKKKSKLKRLKKDRIGNLKKFCMRRTKINMASKTKPQQQNRRMENAKKIMSRHISIEIVCFKLAALFLSVSGL
jgi:hypothetical protein